MSNTKKASKKILEYREYFAGGFLETAEYKQWAAKQIRFVATTIVSTISNPEIDDKYLNELLTSNPSFITLIKKNKSPLIKQWYLEHPLDEATRMQREQTLVVKKLDTVCEKYKKHLFDEINLETKSEVTTGLLLNHQEDVDDGLKPELPTNNNSEKVVDLSESTKIAIKKYAAVTQLQQTLITSKAPANKIQDFKEVLESNAIQKSLSEHRDDRSKLFERTIGYILSKFIGSFSLFKTRGEAVAEELSENIQTVDTTPRLH